MSRRLLVLVYYFLPYGSIGSSIRTVKFAKYLPEFGWEPVILTIDDASGSISRAARFSADEIPASVKIYRARTIERAVRMPAKHVNGPSTPAAFTPDSRLRRTLRYIRSLFLIPDNQILWIPFALRDGLRVVKEESIDVIFATCPPFSVALTGAVLSRQTGKPFVLDVRDDWISPQILAHKPKLIQRIERWQEAWAVRRADRVVLVTQRSREAFCRRYPSQKSKFVYIPNGVDLSEHHLENTDTPAQHCKDGPFTILHSGSMHGNRSPQPILDAVRALKTEYPGIVRRLRLVFRGDMLDKYRQMLTAPDLKDIVEVAPFLLREEYISACRAADVLLVIAYNQAPTLIPAKIYEYWAMQRPMLVLAEDGAARDVVFEHQLGEVVSLHDSQRLKAALLNMFYAWDAGSLKCPDMKGLEQFDRRYLARQLSEILVQVRNGN